MTPPKLSPVEMQQSAAEKVEGEGWTYDMASMSPDAREFCIAGKNRGIVWWRLAVLLWSGAVAWAAFAAREALDWTGAAAIVGQSAPVWALTAVGMLLAWLWCSIVREERLLVIRHVAVQLTETSNSGRSRTVLLDAARVRAVVMNETSTSCRFVFYIALVVSGAEEVQPLFGVSMPPLALSVHLLHSIRHILYGEPDPPHLTQSRYDVVWAESLSRGFRAHPGDDDRVGYMPRWQGVLLGLDQSENAPALSSEPRVVA